jgi:hypothetical protein
MLMALAVSAGTVGGVLSERAFAQHAISDLYPHERRIITGTLVYLSEDEALIDTQAGRVSLSVTTQTRFTHERVAQQENQEEKRKGMPSLTPQTSPSLFKQGDAVNAGIDFGERLEALWLAHASTSQP